jgi:hypothetical protein
MAAKKAERKSVLGAPRTGSGQSGSWMIFADGLGAGSCGPPASSLAAIFAPKLWSTLASSGSIGFGSFMRISSAYFIAPSGLTRSTVLDKIKARRLFIFGGI